MTHRWESQHAPLLVSTVKWDHINLTVTKRTKWVIEVVFEWQRHNVRLTLSEFSAKSTHPLYCDLGGRRKGALPRIPKPPSYSRWFPHRLIYSGISFLRAFLFCHFFILRSTIRSNCDVLICIYLWGVWGTTVKEWGGVRGQLVLVGFLLTPCGNQASNSGRHTWQRVSLPAESRGCGSSVLLTLNRQFPESPRDHGAGAALGPPGCCYLCCVLSKLNKGFQD